MHKNLSINKYLENFYHRKENFKENLIPIDICDKYLPPNSHLYVEKKTGLVCSARTHSEKEILDLWTYKVYKDKSMETGYSSNYPFAEARLKYVVETCKKYLEKKTLPKSICDFAAGTGGAFHSLKHAFQNSYLIATEGSEENAINLKKVGYDSVSQTILSKTSTKKISINNQLPVDLGFLCWTLCNCINPLNVLNHVSEIIKEDGFLCVAESSRILVPAFRKSIRDYLPSKVEPDLHPFHWSFNSLSNVLKLSGFEIIYSNRFIDSDIMLIIAQKKSLYKGEIIIDEYMDVIRFFELWSEMENALFFKYRYGN